MDEAVITFSAEWIEEFTVEEGLYNMIMQVVGFTGVIKVYNVYKPHVVFIVILGNFGKLLLMNHNIHDSVFITFEIKILWSTSQFFFEKLGNFSYRCKNLSSTYFILPKPPASNQVDFFRKWPNIFFWISARRRPIICYLNFLANYPKSKWLNQKLCNPNLVLDAQSLHKAQWYSNHSYIFFFCSSYLLRLLM